MPMGCVLWCLLFFFSLFGCLLFFLFVCFVVVVVLFLNATFFTAQKVLLLVLALLDEYLKWELRNCLKSSTLKACIAPWVGCWKHRSFLCGGGFLCVGDGFCGVCLFFVRFVCFVVVFVGFFFCLHHSGLADFWCGM